MGAGHSSVTVLALTVVYGEARHDLIVELPAGASVTALLRALQNAWPDLPAAAELIVERTGETLPTNAAVTDRDVRYGDTVLVSDAPRRRPDDAVDPEPLVGLRRRGASGEPEVVLAGRVRLRASSLRQAAPPTAPAAREAPTMARLTAGTRTLDIPPGEHVVALTADHEPYLAGAEADGLIALRASSGALEVLNLGPAHAVSVDGTVVGVDWTAARDGGRIRVAGSTFTVEVIPPPSDAGRRERLVVGAVDDHRTKVELGSGGTIDIHRPPRRISAWRAAEVELPPTPVTARRVRLPLIAALVPLVAGVAMFLISKSPYMLMFCALSPMMAFGTYFSERKQGKEGARERADRFEKRLDAAYHDLVTELSVEADERRHASPPIDELLTWTDGPSPRLWERRPWDADFLSLRVGLGDLPAEGRAKLAHASGDVDPDPRLSELAEAARILADVPATVPLGARATVGLSGERTISTALARALVAQAAVLHSPLELGIVAALPPGGEHAWEWLKWVPHTHTGAGAIGRAALGTGRQGIDVLRALHESATARLDARARRGTSAPDTTPALLLLVDEQLLVDRALVSELLTHAQELRIGVIWIGHDPRSLPGQCGTVVDSSLAGLAAVTNVPEGTTVRDVAVETLSQERAELLARALAPARDVTLADRDAAVPSRVKLLDQLALSVPTAPQVAERWQQRAPGIGAEIGMAAGTPLTIDLRSDGPHALIAGTTGAGKSELLRTIVASLAATHPPNRLAFLLIDYKGGAAFAPCAGLPHVLDVVSDLDAELGERALVSLGAEMKRRERLLAEAKADNLLDLERQRPDLAPPNLLIIVDEFAKLREEIPEFIDGVVDIAQRGRTLGIHMILAAQSLRNAFTPAIRANTNLRIALRVTSDSESQDVIDAVDAARIPSTPGRRGRAFARIGHERLIEFQSAHVSGRYVQPEDQEVVARGFSFSDLAVESTRRRRDDDVPPGSEETDLAALRRATQGATELLGIPAPRPAWTEPLPDQLPRPLIQHATDVRRGRLGLGLVDVPSQQQQVPLTIDLDRGHLAVFGMSGAGKTSALLTLATTAAWDAAPSELEIHAIDADGGALSLIEELPHVAAVVAASDAERLERLIARLEGEVRHRSAVLARTGASTLTEHLDQRDAEPMRRILLLVDGFGEFGSLHDTARPDSLFDRLLSVLAAGRSVGVHAAITADRRGAVRSALMPTFPQRVILRLTSPDDAVGFGVPSKLANQIVLRDGRAFVEDHRIAQLALPVPAADASLAEGLAQLAAHLKATWPGEQARGVESLPERVSADQLVPSAGLTRISLGLGGADLATVSVDLSDRHFLITGGYRTGRSTALARFATAALEQELGVAHLIAPRRTPLTELAGWTSVAVGLEASVERAMALADELLPLPRPRSRWA